LTDKELVYNLLSAHLGYLKETTGRVLNDVRSYTKTPLDAVGLLELAGVLEGWRGLEIEGENIRTLNRLLKAAGNSARVARNGPVSDVIPVSDQHLGILIACADEPLKRLLVAIRRIGTLERAMKASNYPFTRAYAHRTIKRLGDNLGFTATPAGIAAGNAREHVSKTRTYEPVD